MAKKTIYNSSDIEPTTTTSNDKANSFIPMSYAGFFKVIIAGIIAGFLVSVLYIVLQKFVFGNVLCRATSTIRCDSAPDFSAFSAIVISGIVSLVVMVNFKIYRPLLIVIATAVGLWGLHYMLSDVPVIQSVLLTSIFTGVSYGLFAWVSRIRRFLIALLMIVIVVVGLRFLLS